MVNITLTTIIPFTWQVKNEVKTLYYFPDASLLSWGRSINHPHSRCCCSDASHVLEFFKHKLVTIPISPVTLHIYLESPGCPHTQSSWLNFLLSL